MYVCIFDTYIYTHMYHMTIMLNTIYLNLHIYVYIYIHIYNYQCFYKITSQVVTFPVVFPKSISEMLGFSFRSLPRGARFERSLRVTGAGAAEMAWEEATEGERGVSGR